MTIVLPISGVAFATFCVWMAVRIVNRRERWAKWTLATLICGAPVLYILSVGPVVWIAIHTESSVEIESLYAPLVWLYGNVPEAVQTALDWYISLWQP